MNQPEHILRTLDSHLRAPTRLILTKMRRVDPQDRDDLRFLVNQPDWNHLGLEGVLDAARIPDILEIREAFELNRQWLAAGLR